MDTLEDNIGWFSAFLNVLFYFAPIYPFFRVLKGQLNYENSPGLFVTTCYINNLVWFIYGDMRFSDQIKYSYLAAAGVSLLFILIYLAYEVRKFIVDSILNLIILITGTWALYRVLTIIIDDDRFVRGLCICTYMIVYLTPIQTLYKVIIDKNYLVLPIYSAFTFLFVCISWIVYGVMLNDNFVIGPHLIGAILSLLQIITYILLKRNYPTINDNSTIGIESTGNEEIKKEEASVKIDLKNLPKIKVKPVKIVSKIDN